MTVLFVLRVCFACAYQKFTLTALESLSGTPSGAQLCIMGMLCQVQDGQFCIEDPHGSVPVDLRHAVLCVCVCRRDGKEAVVTADN